MSTKLPLIGLIWKVMVMNEFLWMRWPEYSIHFVCKKSAGLYFSQWVVGEKQT